MHLHRCLIVLLFAFAAVFLSSCQRPSTDGAPDVKLQLTLTPDPPKVGATSARIALTDANDQPVKGATLKLEANMNHAGMKPVFADAKETEPGVYQAEFEFTMGGDWFLAIKGDLADGRKLRRQVDVPGVKAR